MLGACEREMFMNDTSVDARAETLYLSANKEIGFITRRQKAFPWDAWARERSIWNEL